MGLLSHARQAAAKTAFAAATVGMNPKQKQAFHQQLMQQDAAAANLKVQTDIPKILALWPTWTIGQRQAWMHGANMYEAGGVAAAVAGKEPDGGDTRYSTSGVLMTQADVINHYCDNGWNMTDWNSTADSAKVAADLAAAGIQ